MCFNICLYGETAVVSSSVVSVNDSSATPSPFNESSRVSREALFGSLQTDFFNHKCKHKIWYHERHHDYHGLLHHHQLDYHFKEFKFISVTDSKMWQISFWQFHFDACCQSSLLKGIKCALVFTHFSQILMISAAENFDWTVITATRQNSDDLNWTYFKKFSLFSSVWLSVKWQNKEKSPWNEGKPRNNYEVGWDKIIDLSLGEANKSRYRSSLFYFVLLN